MKRNDLRIKPCKPSNVLKAYANLWLPPLSYPPRKSKAALTTPLELQSLVSEMPCSTSSIAAFASSASKHLNSFVSFLFSISPLITEEIRNLKPQDAHTFCEFRAFFVAHMWQPAYFGLDAQYPQYLGLCFYL